MLSIILHHAGLELVSKEIANIHHKAIINDALRRNKDPTELLLDIAYHQSAINADKLHFTGRPDLVHIFLLQYHFLVELLDAEDKANIELLVHTRNDEIFTVPQTWRVPVHFIRFRGLMEKLLVENEIKLTQRERLVLEKKTLLNLINAIKPKNIIQLVETGEKKINLIKIIEENMKEENKSVILIGGYQKGEYDLEKLLDQKIYLYQLGEKPTTAWMTLNLILTGLILKRL